MTPARTLLAAATAAATLIFPSAALATVTTDAANRLRAAAGLAVVDRSDPAAVARAGAGDVRDVDPDAISEPSGAAVTYAAVSAASSTEGMAYFKANRDALALVMDPRVVTLDEVLTGAKRVLAVTIDPQIPFTTPLLSRRTFNPLTDDVDVIAPVDVELDDIKVQQHTRGRWTTITDDLNFGDDSAGYADTGVRVISVGDALTGTWFAFGAPLRLTVRGVATAGTVRVAKLPASARKRPLRFAPGTRARDKALVRDAIRSFNAPARRLIDLVDGFTTITIAQPPESTGLASPDRSGGGWSVMLSPSVIRGPRTNRRILVAHELGHVVDYAGLDPKAQTALNKTIPRRGKCQPGRSLYATGPCANVAERIADTFAKWATGVRTFKNIGYNVPAPRSFRAFQRTLTRGFQFKLSGNPTGAWPGGAPGRRR